MGQDFASFQIPVSSGLVDYEIYCHGDKLIYQAGSVELTIKIDGNQRGTFVLKPGQYFKGDFKKIYISCSASSQVVNLIITSADKFEIGMIDGVNILSNNSPFTGVEEGRIYGFTTVSVGTGTEYPYVGFYNPSDSGKNIKIHDCEFLTNGGVDSYIASISSLVGSESTYQPYTLNSFTIDSVVKIISFTSATGPVGYIAANAIMLGRYRSSQYVVQKVNARVKSAIVPPGSGFIIGSATTSLYIQLSGLFEEVDV